MLWSGVGGQLLSYHFGGLYSANLRSRFSQQIFSADFLSRSSQQIFSADLLSIFSADLLSRSFAVVRGWWSAIVLSFAVSFAVVRGWWSAIVLSFWWSILHEFFRRTLSRSFREKIQERKEEVNPCLAAAAKKQRLEVRLISQ